MSADNWLNVVGLGLALFSMLAGGIYQLTRVEARLNERIVAVLAKHAASELEAYKVFVRRDSFHELLNRLAAENAAFKEAIEARLDRTESKIDRLIERGGKMGG